eukprot:2045-Eustigmatos_ZCMA.PRE.1
MCAQACVSYAAATEEMGAAAPHADPPGLRVAVGSFDHGWSASPREPCCAPCRVQAAERSRCITVNKE